MKSLLFLCVALAVVLAGCASLQADTPGASPATSGSANLANPASVYCTQHGGSVVIRTDATGAQSGICRFANGAECDEWFYFRGQCAPSEPVDPKLTREQARDIAKAEPACKEVGNLKEETVFNPSSRTWWIDLESSRPGCNPACVVKEDGTAEVNWRCTGAVEPTTSATRP